MGRDARLKVGPRLAADLHEAVDRAPVNTQNRHVRFVDRSYTVDPRGTYRRIPAHVPSAVLRVVSEKK
jgi:hypothetical protein